MSRIYLGLGSNLGDRENNLRCAIDALAPEIKVLKISPIYETEPVGYVAQPRFLNLVLEAQTSLSAPGLLRSVKGVEEAMGRKRSVRFGPRNIDIDILLYGDEAMESSALTVPHPRMHERAFVLVPLADIAPDARHSILGKVVAELKAELGDVSNAVRLYSQV